MGAGSVFSCFTVLTARWKHPPTHRILSLHRLSMGHLTPPPPPSCRSSVRIYWTAMVSSPSSFNSVTLMTRLLIRHNEAAAVSRASMSETQPTVKQTDRCFIWRFYWQFIVTKGPQFNTVNQMCQNINIYFYVQVSDCILYWLYIVCTIH